VNEFRNARLGLIMDEMAVTCFSNIPTGVTGGNRKGNEKVGGPRLSYSNRETPQCKSPS
jgi:hypothetical protein